ncbi:MAG: hypothetical protein R3B84_19675 [Zavarzinella sp.]
MKLIKISCLATIIFFSGCESLEDMAFHPGPPASTQAHTRVEVIGQKLVAAKPDLFQNRPQFSVVGIPEKQLYHRKNMIVISEGMLNAFPNDDQLATAIAYELGSMAAEMKNQQAKAALQSAAPRPLAGDVVGGNMAPDMTHQAEQALFQRDQQREVMAARVDPRELSEAILIQAGYSTQLLDQIAPIVEKTQVGTGHQFLR